MKKSILAFLLLLISLILSSCMTDPDDIYYYAGPEKMVFINQSDSTVHIDFSKIKNSISADGYIYYNYDYNYYEGSNYYLDTTFLDDYILKLPSDTSTEIYFSYEAKDGLWITENQFNDLVSKIKIFQIIEEQNIYVPVSNYGTKQKWDYNIENNNYSYIRHSGSILVIDTLKINNEMFN